MSWDMTKLCAFLTWPPCAAIFFIACCRLNAMPKSTRFSVVLEYALWAAAAILIPALPFIGEWPGPGFVCLVWALAGILYCSRHAWVNDLGKDAAPAIVTDHAPLSELPADIPPSSNY